MLFLGTSGWSYKHWAEMFYPPGLPAREQLRFLARRFNTVELNASFYRLPAVSSFAKWYDDTPAGFRFSVKVPRVITHYKRLVDVVDDWRELLAAAEPLAAKINVYLAQFPPSFRANDDTMLRLDAFVELARASGRRLACEFRHASWFESAALELFERQQICLVQAESSRYPHSPAGFAPADFVYYRFHGPHQLYASQYTDQELADWAALMRADIVAERDVYAYFDNDFEHFAVQDAERLRLLVAP